MMRHAARFAAAIEILDEILAGAPAEKTLTGWARGHRFAGSKDRAAIRDHVFDALRMKRSCAALGGAETGRGIVLGLCLRQGLDATQIFTEEGHAPDRLTTEEQYLNETTSPETLLAFPPAVRLDCPDWVFERLTAQLGPEAEVVLEAQQDRAPVFLRVNTLRGQPETSRAMLAHDTIITAPVEGMKEALKVTENERKIRNCKAYQEGFVELQDISSQASVSTLELHPNSRILDYCAGGGGKSLALAAHPARPSAIFAHDISPERMRDLPPRADRAGAQVTVISTQEIERHAPFDLVFVDAPCSGSGTWRRTPDAKWRLTEQTLSDYSRTQAEVLEKASQYVVEGGALVYATCSIFWEENEAQVDGFLSRNEGWTLVSATRSDTATGGDGFFSAEMRRIDEKHRKVALRRA